MTRATGDWKNWGVTPHEAEQATAREAHVFGRTLAPTHRKRYEEFVKGDEDRFPMLERRRDTDTR